MRCTTRLTGRPLQTVRNQHLTNTAASSTNSMILYFRRFSDTGVHNQANPVRKLPIVVRTGEFLAFSRGGARLTDAKYRISLATREDWRTTAAYGVGTLHRRHTINGLPSSTIHIAGSRGWHQNPTLGVGVIGASWKHYLKHQTTANTGIVYFEGFLDSTAVPEGSTSQLTGLFLPHLSSPAHYFISQPSLSSTTL